MAEYIDKQTVIDTLDGLCDIVCQYSKKQRAFMCGACNLGSAFDVLQELPAADVAPVRHGRWIYNEKSMAVCSICGNVVAFVSHPDSKWEFGHYCPNCGAKMDGET